MTTDAATGTAERSSLAVIWNPAKTSRDDLEAAHRAASGPGEDAQPLWIETSKDDPGAGALDAAVAAGASLVLVAGGDGTVRAVLEQAARVDAAIDIGLVPLGTGNLLARNLGIPLADAGRAFDTAMHGVATPIDVGWATTSLDGTTCERGFVVMAGFGLDAHMIDETDDDLKDTAGWLAYVESLGRAFAAAESVGIRCTVDGGDTTDESAHTVLIGSCGTLQGGITLLPDADPSDGILDMLMLGADDASSWLTTARTMVWDNGLRRLLRDDRATSTEHARHVQARSMRLELDERRPFQIDGDLIGEIDEVQIRVQPGAVRVRSPRPAPTESPARHAAPIARDEAPRRDVDGAEAEQAHA